MQKFETNEINFEYVHKGRIQKMKEPNHFLILEYNSQFCKLKFLIVKNQTEIEVKNHTEVFNEILEPPNFKIFGENRDKLYLVSRKNDYSTHFQYYRINDDLTLELKNEKIIPKLHRITGFDVNQSTGDLVIAQESELEEGNFIKFSMISVISFNEEKFETIGMLKIDKKKKYSKVMSLKFQDINEDWALIYLLTHSTNGKAHFIVYSFLKEKRFLEERIAEKFGAVKIDEIALRNETLYFLDQKLNKFECEFKISSEEEEEEEEESD